MVFYCLNFNTRIIAQIPGECFFYRDADKSLARPGRKQATATNL